jgi:hypothetical protein
VAFSPFAKNRLMYSLIFSAEALAEMRALEPPATRRNVTAVLQRIALDPETRGLTEMIDAEGRINRVGLLNTVAFVFWTDHAMKRMRVLAVKSMVE